MSRTKANKVWYSIGAGVNFMYDQLHSGIKYNLEIDKKYTAHQVMLKFKFNF